MRLSLWLALRLVLVVSMVLVFVLAADHEDVFSTVHTSRFDQRTTTDATDRDVSTKAVATTGVADGGLIAIVFLHGAGVDLVRVRRRSLIGIVCR